MILATTKKAQVAVKPARPRRSVTSVARILAYDDQMALRHENVDLHAPSVDRKVRIGVGADTAGPQMQIASHKGVAAAATLAGGDGG